MSTVTETLERGVFLDGEVQPVEGDTLTILNPGTGELVGHGGDRLGDHLLGAARTVHLGGIDQGHAELDPEPHRGRLFRGSTAVLAHVPGSLAERRHACAARQCHHRQLLGHRVPSLCGMRLACESRCHGVGGAADRQ